MKNKERLEKLGYTVEKSVSGYYRLLRDETIIHDDSACEDVNDSIEIACAFFFSLVTEGRYDFMSEDKIDQELS